MNPFATIDYELITEPEKNMKELSTKYSCVITELSAATFKWCTQVSKEASACSLPFYGLGQVGLQGFFFADLGKDKFEFTQNKGEAAEAVGSKCLPDYLDAFQNVDSKLGWKKRELQKAGKTLLLCLMAQAIDSEKPSEAMQEFLKKKAGLKEHQDRFASLPITIAAFDKYWRQPIQFNPVQSVVASIASQEILKVVTRKDAPEHGFFLYDSYDQKMDIEKV